MGLLYGYGIIKPEDFWWVSERRIVRKGWRMMCIPEWWVMLERHDPFELDRSPSTKKLACPLKTKEAAEAALMMMEEN